MDKLEIVKFIFSGASLIPDVATPFGIAEWLIDGVQLGANLKLRTFILGLLGNDNVDELTESDIKKVEKLIDIDQKSNRIIGLLEGVLRANSHISILLMSDQLRRMLEQNSRMLPQEMTLSASLLQMNDYDFYVFEKLVPILEDYKNNDKDLTTDAPEFEGIEEIESELYKLTTLQIISMNMAHVVDGRLTFESVYCGNSITSLLIDRMKSCEKRIEKLGCLDIYESHE